MAAVMGLQEGEGEETSREGARCQVWPFLQAVVMVA